MPDSLPAAKLSRKLSAGIVALLLAMGVWMAVFIPFAVVLPSLAIGRDEPSVPVILLAAGFLLSTGAAGICFRKIYRKMLNKLLLRRRPYDPGK